MFGWNNEDKSRKAACPEYYIQIEGIPNTIILNGTVVFACKYNPDNQSIPFEICIPDSFSCGTATLTEYEELQNYDQSLTQLVTLVLLIALLGGALIFLGCSSLIPNLLSLAVTPQIESREYSTLDDGNHERGLSAS